MQDVAQDVGGDALKTKVTESYYDGYEATIGKNAFKSKPFTFKDTGDVLELDVWSTGKAQDVKLPIKLVNKQGKVVQTKEVTVKNVTGTAVSFTDVPTGEYTVQVDKNAAFSDGGTLGLSPDVLHIKGKHYESMLKPTRIVMKHKNWGSYEGTSLDTVRGDLNTIPGNNLGADSTKTDLYVYGYQLAADGKTVQATSPEYHRVPQGKEIKIGTETGYLTIDSAGKYTFEPVQEIASYGRQDRVKYRVNHYSGKSAEAELIFNNHALLNTTVDDNIITSTVGKDIIKGQGGSDTLIYSVIDMNDATAGNNHNEWVDFTYGSITTNREADRIDLRQLYTVVKEDSDGNPQLVDQVITKDNLNTYLNVELRDSNKIVVKIDRDGTGRDFEFAEVITLTVQNPEALPEDLNKLTEELIKNGQLLINMK